MSKNTLRLTVLATILSAAVLASPARAGAGPKLVCEQTVRDFGKVGNVGALAHTFVIRNEGDQPLKILNVVTCSSCTNPELSRSEIPPGETAELATEASVYGKTGPVSLDITLRTNDPANRMLKLELRAAVEPWVNVRPLRVSFQRTGDDEAATRKVDILATKHVEPFAVTGVETNADWLSAKVASAEKGRRHRVIVGTVPPMPRGWHDLHVRVNTDSEKIGSFDIPVRAMIIGELMVWPDKVSLLESDSSRRVRRHVDVLPGKVEEFEIISVQPPVTMDVKVEPTGMGGTGRRIWLNDISVSSELDGLELIITTDVEAMETIRVPFEVKAGKPCPGCP